MRQSPDESREAETLQEPCRLKSRTPVSIISHSPLDVTGVAPARGSFGPVVLAQPQSPGQFSRVHCIWAKPLRGRGRRRCHHHFQRRNHLDAAKHAYNEFIGERGVSQRQVHRRWRTRDDPDFHRWKRLGDRAVRRDDASQLRCPWRRFICDCRITRDRASVRHRV